MVIFPVIDARINEATVNNSRTVYSALVFNTFDNEGNYNKTDWQDYQLISEQLMDKIEDGIYWNRYDLNSKYDNVIVEESEDEIELTFYSFGKKLKTISFSRGSKDYNDLINKPIIPTKVSELENDSNYLTEIPSEYITEEELNAKDLPTKEYVDEAILQAKLDKEEIDLSDYARKTYVDEGLETKSDKDHTHEEYLTEIPSEYITETELNAKGYLTEIPSEYITEEELEFKDYPTKKFVNDSIIQAQLGETDMSNFAPINSPKFVNSISLGRKSDSTTGIYSVALGLNTTATQLHSIALGYGANSTGLGSMALGYGTIASNNYQMALGKYNVEDTENKYALIYGNGTSDTDRKNIHTLDFNGNAWFLGNVSVDGTPTNNNHVVTKSYVDTAIGNIDVSNMDLSEYAKKTDIPSLKGYATETFVSNRVKELSDTISYKLSDYVTNTSLINRGYASEKYVDEAIANIELGNIDLSGYATKTYVIEEIAKAQLGGEDGEINLSGYVTITELDSRGYATETYVNEIIRNTGGNLSHSNPVFTGSISMGRLSSTKIGSYSVALGTDVDAYEFSSVAMGHGCTAKESSSVAMGDTCTTEGVCSVAIGNQCSSNYHYSYTFGNGCTANATESVAIGIRCSARRWYSTAIGCNAITEGNSSMSLGNHTVTKGNLSLALGNRTIARGTGQCALGYANIEDVEEKYLYVIGNGEANIINIEENEYEIIRSNAHTLDWSGNGWYQGELYVGGTSQDNANKVFSTKDIYFDSNGYLCVTINGVTKKFAPIN